MSTPDAPWLQRLDEVRPIIDAAFAGMTQAVAELGVADGMRWMAVEAAHCSLVTDPSDGGRSLVAVWRDARGVHVGDLIVHADGSFYIEYEIGMPHPHKSGWLVDAVIAWGRDGVVKAEPRLLPPL